MNARAAIEVENLVREFRKGPRAVDGIDLAVSPGEIYGFLGPNGAGKSTTVLMLTTLLPPTSGRATVGGYDIVRQGAQVRATIGAALQEAALDAILTGREHLILQATLQGLPAPERRRRAQALLERVGLTEAADRRVGGYSGGMKRRLDLALALVHSPRILFLDEPTTGLDVQSRTALWEEVARLARDEGMTVFLTTQYLEEADILADRIGIIDHGSIVAEGTPAELKAEIGSPTVEVTPTDPEAGDRLGELLAGFGEMRRNGRGSVTVQLPGGESELAEIVRILDRADCTSRPSSSISPRWTTCSWLRPVVSWRDREAGPWLRPPSNRAGAGGGDVAVETTGSAPGAASLARGASFADQSIALGRRAVLRTVRQRGLVIFPMVFPLILFAINGSALSPATHIPGFPTDNYRDFLIAMPFIQGAMFVSITAGVDLARDIESGFLNRLAMTPLRGEALLLGQLGGALVVGVIQAVVYLLFGLATGVTLVSGVGGALVLLALSILISFAFASLGEFLALRFGTGEAVQAIFPLLFVTLFLSSSSLPRNLIKASWFREVATYNPISYLLEGLRSLVITGWDAQALALGFGFAVALLVVSLGLSRSAMKTRLARR